MRSKTKAAAVPQRRSRTATGANLGEAKASAAQAIIHLDQFAVAIARAVARELQPDKQLGGCAAACNDKPAQAQQIVAGTERGKVPKPSEESCIALLDDIKELTYQALKRATIVAENFGGVSNPPSSGENEAISPSTVMGKLYEIRQLLNQVGREQNRVMAVFPL